MEKDINKFLEYTKKSAEFGNVESMAKQGITYYIGDNGVKVDYKEAYKWNKEAAFKGDIGATYLMGRMHQRGEGTEMDLNKAVSFYEIAFNKGHI